MCTQLSRNSLNLNLLNNEKYLTLVYSRYQHYSGTTVPFQLPKSVLGAVQQLALLPHSEIVAGLCFSSESLQVLITSL